MKRLILVVLLFLLLALVGSVAWRLAGLPPVRLVLRYGFSYGCEPTGQKKALEGVEFVEIGPGCIRMGSTHLAEGGDLLGKVCSVVGLPWGDQPKPSDEMPVHWVEFRRGFFIARTEVTNEQYEEFDPEHERSEYSSGDRDPVVDVSWEDAKKYCAWLSSKSGLPVRLPSESEWECACRAGSEREFSFGDDEEALAKYAWFDANSEGRAREVGTRRENAWGLHDLHGNVWEWCEDTYHPNYEGAPADGTAWRDEGTPIRVFRGGCWILPAVICRSAFRYWGHPSFRDWVLGFRPAFLPLED